MQLIKILFGRVSWNALSELVMSMFSLFDYAPAGMTTQSPGFTHLATVNK